MLSEQLAYEHRIVREARVIDANAPSVSDAKTPQARNRRIAEVRVYLDELKTAVAEYESWLARQWDASQGPDPRGHIIGATLCVEQREAVAAVVCRLAHRGRTPVPCDECKHEMEVAFGEGPIAEPTAETAS